jgi:hypothetical protein
MQGKAMISVQANLASGTTARLQAQLNAIAKKMTFNIGKINLQNQQFNKSIQNGLKQVTQTSQKSTSSAVKANQKTIDSVDKLIQRYKAGHISAKQFSEYGTKMAQSDTFKNKSLQQQAKLYGQLDSATKKYSQTLRGESSVRQLQNKQMQTGLDRISAINRAIGDKKAGSTGAQIFSNPAVKSNLDELNRMMSTFGQTGGASIKQINTQFARMQSSISAVTAAQRDQQYSFGNMIREGAKAMLIWSNNKYNKIKDKYFILPQCSVYRVICT